MSDPMRHTVSKIGAPYTKAEIDLLGDALPTRGEYCPRCETYIPGFADLSPTDIQELRALRSIHLMKAVREKTGCSLVWAKIWALHPHGPHSLDPSKPCPYCELPLHVNAKQCVLCKMNWHDPENPRQLGKSVAAEIMAAPNGGTVLVPGRNALGSAITYAQMKRPDDNLTLQLAPLPNSSKPSGLEGNPESAS